MGFFSQGFYYGNTIIHVCDPQDNGKSIYSKVAISCAQMNPGNDVEMIACE